MVVEIPGARRRSAREIARESAAARRALRAAVVLGAFFTRFVRPRVLLAFARASLRALRE